MSLNEKLFKLACAVHGLEEGDPKALDTYEMIKQFLIDNNLAEGYFVTTHNGKQFTTVNGQDELKFHDGTKIKVKPEDE